MKNWGRYELVGSPSDADLVFEISFAAPMVGADKLTTFAPNLRLEILDAKTHFLLWTIIEPVDGALSQGHLGKEFQYWHDKSGERFEEHSSGADTDCQQLGKTLRSFG